MTLAPLMTVHADLKSPADIGTGPYGTRMVFDVTGDILRAHAFEGPYSPVEAIGY